MLLIDIGNSRLKFAFIRENTNPAGLLQIEAIRAISRQDFSNWKDLPDWLQRVPSEVLVSSVNQQILEVLKDLWHGHPEWRVARTTPDFPLPLLVRKPEKLGIDRALQALAANRIRETCPGKSVIVVAAGTATTIDLVNEKGEMEGGAILPGLALAANSLHEHTDQLPLIDLAKIPDAPPALGQDTQEAIASGIIWGQVGAIKEIVSRIGNTHSLGMVIVTGGDGPILYPHLVDELRTPVHSHPDLTLTGLALWGEWALKKN